MNKRLVIRMLSAILLIEAACMIPSLILAFVHADGDAASLAYSILILCAVGLPGFLFVRPESGNLRAREGFFIVAFSWLLLSLFGALPFYLSGMIPNYLNAVYESVSGFTTTGATIIDHFEGLPRGVMFWRAFTHWIGGMGVLVLTLALIPKLTGRTTHLVRAESPGPSLSKVVPKTGDSAKIMYIIYLSLTLLEFIALMIAGLSPYDAAIHAMSNAGTGGFSNYAASAGAFDSVAVDTILTVFMFLFGINFALFYHALLGKWKEFFGSEELRWYSVIVLVSVLSVSAMIAPLYNGFLTALRYGSFQVMSFVSTTGFVTADYNSWPVSAKSLLMVLMFIGSCAGSTAGGMKVVRVTLLVKELRLEILRTFQPRKVQAIRFENRSVDRTVLDQVNTFAFAYFLLVIVGAFLISMENRYSLESNFFAALTSVSNVGPLFSQMTPISSMSGYGPFAKVTMCMLMLAGRLEIFPMLALFHPAIWKKH